VTLEKESEFAKNKFAPTICRKSKEIIARSKSPYDDGKSKYE